MMEALTYPPFLEKGDKVIIISPSGKIEREIVAKAWKRLASWGLRVKVAPHYADSYASFAGTWNWVTLLFSSLMRKCTL